MVSGRKRWYAADFTLEEIKKLRALERLPWKPTSSGAYLEVVVQPYRVQTNNRFPFEFFPLVERGCGIDAQL
jgi:hypothetical protein